MLGDPYTDALLLLIREALVNTGTTTLRLKTYTRRGDRVTRLHVHN